VDAFTVGDERDVDPGEMDVDPHALRRSPIAMPAAMMK
jgi:hypothetical protein